ncbi:hypothetical protein CCP3SC1AL1_110045 [Gammaproteobacteria bacterium]
MSEIMRNQIADYLNTGSIVSPSWALMGAGFNSLDEKPAAQIKSQVYINDASETSSIKSYKPVFSFDTDLITDEDAIEKLYDIGRNERIGSGAQVEYVRVELFQAGAGTNLYKARKFTVAVEVATLEGKGGETVKVTGNLNNVGSFVDGEFNVVTKEFIAYDADLSTLEITSSAGATAKTIIGIYPLTPGTGYSYRYKSAASVTLPVYGDDLTAGWTALINGAELTGLTAGHEIVVAKVLTAGNLCRGLSNKATVVLGA